MALQMILPFLLEPFQALVKKREVAQEAPHEALPDLQAIAAKVNQHYFANAIEVKIAWSRQVKKKRRRRKRSLLLGSYSRDKNLVRIHPALSAAWVPSFFIEYVVYHEMLHAAVPPRKVGRTVYYHPPEFRKRERLFAFYKDAVLWQRKNIERLLAT